MTCIQENRSGALRQDSTDSRQEWCDEVYICRDCGHEYLLKTIFKTQSSIIHSQVLYDEDMNEVG